MKAVLEIPPPGTQTALRKFLGAVNYIRFCIPGFSMIAAPLYELLTAGAPRKFVLEGRHLEAFNNLKAAIAAAVAVNHIDPTQPVVVRTDASDVAIGGVVLSLR